MKLNYIAICTNCGIEQPVKLTLCEKFAFKFLNDNLIYRKCHLCEEKDVFEILEG